MREVGEYKSFYADASGGEGRRCRYPTRLDTYGCGCAHDCNYCYARSLLRFRGNWHPESPKVADISKVVRRLKRVRPGTILRLGGMTDCLQPCEAEHGVTRRAIEVMNSLGIGYLIVTKSAMVAEDGYLPLLDPKLAHVQVSLTSTSDEPNFLGENASPPSERIRAAQALQDAGVDVQLRLSPYIPELVDLGVVRDAGIRKGLVEFLRVNGFISRWLGEAGFDTSAYTLREGGYRHLPLEAKRATWGSSPGASTRLASARTFRSITTIGGSTSTTTGMTAATSGRGKREAATGA